MQNILEEIYQHKLVEVRNCKKEISLQEICKEIKCLQKPKDFSKALKDKVLQGKNALICEIKKASPAKGLIRKNFDVIDIVKQYEQAGAACISVLTDEKYFQGSNKYLEQVRANTDLPILRKDFIVDKYQIYEAKKIGADCILLIVAMLDDQKLQEFENCALDLGLSVLIEIHNEEELNRALKLKSRLLGINNRDLKTLKIDLKTSLNLVKKIPNDYFIISESGIKNIEDIKILNEAGIRSFLVGEHFMQQENIFSEVRKFL